MICQALYLSQRVTDGRPEDLEDILEASRRNNPDIGITGMLTITAERYVQILEGPRDSVDTLLEFIAQDPRHGEMRVITRTMVEDRLFGSFAMAEARAGDVEAAALDADLDALMKEPDAARAREVVRGFARYALAS